MCDERFTEGGHRRMHLLIHTGDKPHTCSICKKDFTWAATLRRHILIYTVKKPHICIICMKQFIQTESLKEKVFIHKVHKFSLGSNVLLAGNSSVYVETNLGEVS